MPEALLKYQLTPKQAIVLRALQERVVEASPTEVAVSALMAPAEVNTALGKIERLGLANSWVPVTGRRPEPVFVLSEDGREVARALSSVKGTPAVGTVVRVGRILPDFLESLVRMTPEYVKIAPDDPT